MDLKEALRKRDWIIHFGCNNNLRTAVASVLTNLGYIVPTTSNITYYRSQGIDRSVYYGSDIQHAERILGSNYKKYTVIDLEHLYDESFN